MEVNQNSGQGPQDDKGGQVPPDSNVPPKSLEGKGQDDADQDHDLFANPEKAKAEILRLRKEAAAHRTKSKDLEGRLTGTEQTLSKLKSALGIEGDEDGEQDSPESRIESLTAQTQALAMDRELTMIALQSGITDLDGLDYFKFLVGQRANELEEGEELGEEVFEDVIQRVLSISGGAKKGTTRSGIDSSGAAGKADQSGTGDITLEMFSKMSVVEKSDLYSKKPDLYQSLFKQAAEKGLI